MTKIDGQIMNQNFDEFALLVKFQLPIAQDQNCSLRDKNLTDTLCKNDLAMSHHFYNQLHCSP